MSHAVPAGKVSLRPWIQTTFLGWLLGIVLVIAIALVGEVVGVQGSQISVGLGMGLGVGFADLTGERVA